MAACRPAVPWPAECHRGGAVKLPLGGIVAAVPSAEGLKRTRQHALTPLYARAGQQSAECDIDGAVLALKELHGNILTSDLHIDGSHGARNPDPAA